MSNKAIIKCGLLLLKKGKKDEVLESDRNGDGKVDIADFVSVLNLMAEQ